LLVGAGCSFAGLGICVLTGQILLAHPWLAVVALGGVLVGIGLFLMLDEDGMLPLLPDAAMHAIFNISAVELILGLRTALRDMRAGKGLDASTNAGCVVPLAALCLLELDRDLTEVCLDGLDGEVRRVAFQPGLAHLLPIGARRLLLGRTGTRRLEEGTAELTPRNIAHRLAVASEQQPAASMPHQSRAHTTAGREGGSVASVQRTYGGGLWLATRLLNYTLVIAPLRTVRHALFDSLLWRRFSSVPSESPSCALSSALHWLVFAPVAWLLRFIQLQLDERQYKQRVKVALKNE